MRRVAVLFAVSWCVSTFACTVRERRPDGPYRQAEEFVDALSDIAVECAGEHAPDGTGAVVVFAELTGKDEAPVLHDRGSMPGSEPLIACVRKRAGETLRCPPTAPGRFARVRLPIPLVTSQVTYAFTDEL
jgi:hypothetical protein